MTPRTQADRNQEHDRQNTRAIEINRMVASDALDEMIARQVMGWDLDCEGYWVDATTHDYTGWGDDAQAGFSGPGVLNSPRCSKFNPSVGITAAWRVVESIIARGHAVYVPDIHVKTFADGWMAIYDLKYNMQCHGDAPTPMLAICKMALMVVEDLLR
jgi:hypothetical protein